MAVPKGNVLLAKKRQAVELLRTGRLNDAGKLLEELCAKVPLDRDVWLLRSRIHGMQGEYQEVLECANRVIAIDPKNATGHSHLGSALAGLGRRAESLEALQRARELAPNDPSVLSNLGNALYLAERVEEAEGHFRRALEVAPQNLEAHYGLGHALVAMGLNDEAMLSYQRAAQLNPNSYEVLHGLGLACLHTGRLEQAESCFQRALRVATDPVEAHCELSRVARARGDYDAALTHLEDALHHDPDSVAILSDQADVYLRRGDREKAYGRIRELLDQEIVTALIVTVYASLCRYLGDCAEVVSLGERLLAEEALGRGDRIAVHFALGGGLDGMARYDEAFAHYRQGNDLTAHRFDRAGHSAKVDSLIAGYSAAVVAEMPRASNTSERPVFIVGMPRSGTSLAEQILASHPRVFGAGELADVEGMAAKVSAHLYGPYYHEPEAVEQSLLDELAEAHLRRLDELSGSADRVTDKMPQNFEHLGLIGQLFPGARVIHCTRDPRDTCLSIYFQRFIRTHSYSWDLGDLAFYFTEYRRLMRHWQGVAPVAMIEVNYETLVGDLEGETRRMLEFLGLEWDARCLAFHETERPVATASFDQVRQPLYTKSVGRWQRYKAHLGPLLEGLGLAP
ncbi:MAG TPA: sulfotransferase [Gemmatimonadales bacterium]